MNPTTGTYAVHAATSINDTFFVGPGEVAVELGRRGIPAALWWAQSGTVDVKVEGSRIFFEFTDLPALLQSDHSQTTNLGGFLICTPPTRG